MLRAQGKKTKKGEDLKFNPIERKKFDKKGHEVCDEDIKKRKKSCEDRKDKE